MKYALTSSNVIFSVVSSKGPNVKTCQFLYYVLEMEVEILNTPQKYYILVHFATFIFPLFTPVQLCDAPDAQRHAEKSLNFSMHLYFIFIPIKHYFLI